jgi:hypothetical protein
VVSRDQFNALRAASGHRIRLTGELHYAQRTSETVLVSVKIHGRTAAPNCQYAGPNIPMVYLDTWHRD